VAIAALGVAGGIAEWIGRRTLALVSIAFAVTLAGAANLDTAAIFATRTNPDHRAVSAAVAEVHKAFAEAGLSDRRILTWFNRDAFTSASHTKAVYEMDFAGQTYRYNLLDSIAATFGWSQTTLGFDLPHVDAKWWHKESLTVGRAPTAVLVLCAEPNECRIGEHTLTAYGMSVNEIAMRRIEVPRVPAFSFAILDVLSNGRP